MQAVAEQYTDGLIRLDSAQIWEHLKLLLRTLYAVAT